jgi:hypothetical protein
VFCCAVSEGNLDIMKWLLTNNCEHLSLNRICLNAAINGNLTNLKWLKDNNFKISNLNYNHGYFIGKEVKQWLLQNSTI